MRPVPPEGPAPLRYRDDVFSSVTTTTGITYGQAVKQDGTPLTLQLDLYRPTGDTATDRPLMIWVHGGSFAFGTRTSAELVDQATALSRKGYVNASITYRLSAQGCTVINAGCVESIVDATEDAQAAVRFLRAHAADYGIDPTRIAIGGTSAGAITALHVGAGLSVPGNSGTPGVSSEVSSAVALSGANYLGGIDATDAPSLLFHGTADPLVPYSLAVQTRDRSIQAGVASYLITWPGDGHVPYLPHRDQIMGLTTNFLYHTLDLG